MNSPPPAPKPRPASLGLQLNSFRGRFQTLTPEICP